MKSIGQIIHNKVYTLRIRDLNKNPIYREFLNGYWTKWKYNSNGKEIYYENSNGDIVDNRVRKTIAQIIHNNNPLKIRNLNGQEIYYENVLGYWLKRQYDANGKQIYFETSSGYIEDKR